MDCSSKLLVRGADRSRNLAHTMFVGADAGGSHVHRPGRWYLPGFCGRYWMLASTSSFALDRRPGRVALVAIAGRPCAWWCRQPDPGSQTRTRALVTRVRASAASEHR